MDAVIEKAIELADEVSRLQAENERLRARLAELQKPQGHQEERVAEWLREHGYAVTRVEQ
jgi:regulator of replication initiation timing